MATPRSYPSPPSDSATDLAIQDLAKQARAATGEQQFKLKQQLLAVMNDANRREDKAAGVSVRWAVQVTDLQGVRAFAIDNGFVEVDAHADEERLRLNLGEWVERRLADGLSVPADGFEVRDFVQLRPLPSEPRLR